MERDSQVDYEDDGMKQHMLKKREEAAATTTAGLVEADKNYQVQDCSLALYINIAEETFLHNQTNKCNLLISVFFY